MDAERGAEMEGRVGGGLVEAGGSMRWLAFFSVDWLWLGLMVTG